MLGVDPATLAAYDLRPDPCPPTDRYTDNVPDKIGRLRRSPAGAAWLEEWGWAPGDDVDIIGRVPVEILDDVFSISEIVHMWSAQVVRSRISDHIDGHHPLLEKLRHTAWHFTNDGPMYNVIVSAWRGLQRTAWPGGDIRIAYVSKYREDGWAEDIEHDVWIDNDLAALVHINGEHVLTVGFGVGNEGVFLSQVQLRKKRGNRWLYRLGQHYLDATIDMLAKAFGMPVWLVDGDSAVAAVRRSYGSQPCSLTTETSERIASLYNRPLVGYDRTDNRRAYHGREYAMLQEKIQ